MTSSQRNGRPQRGLLASLLAALGLGGAGCSPLVSPQDHLDPARAVSLHDQPVQRDVLNQILTLAAHSPSDDELRAVLVAVIRGGELRLGKLSGTDGLVAWQSASVSSWATPLPRGR